MDNNTKSERKDNFHNKWKDKSPNNKSNLLQEFSSKLEIMVKSNPLKIRLFSQKKLP